MLFVTADALYAVDCIDPIDTDDATINNNATCAIDAIAVDVDAGHAVDAVDAIGAVDAIDYVDVPVLIIFSP